MTGQLRVGALMLAILAGCGHTSKRPVTPPPRLPAEAMRKPHPPPPAEWFWEAVDVDIHATARRPLSLPVDEKAIVKPDGAAKVWSDLPVEAKDRLKKDGVLVLGSEIDPLPPSSLGVGAFYRDLAEKHVRAVVTMDALFALTRRAIEAALAQAEDNLAPAVDQLLTALDTRLAAESKGVGATLSEAYRIARGVIATARVLAQTPSANPGPAPSPGPAPTPAAPAPRPATRGKLAPKAPPAVYPPEVLAEKALVEAHAAAAASPVLGVSMDYTRFVVPSSASKPGLFRALAYLGTAPFALAGRGEIPGPAVDVAQARTSTRAALLVARLCDRDIDANSYALYTRITRLLAFVWGSSDDLTLLDLDDIGTAAGVDLTKPEHVLDVAKVDKVRAGALKRRAPAVYDGLGGIGRTARIFGGHASPDAIALESLLGKATGPAQPTAPPSIQRDNLRVIPSTLDVAAWLGAPGAKTALNDSHADDFDAFDPALAKAITDRPPEDGDAYHSSVYGSLLASVLALAAPPEQPPPLPAERLRLESVLSAWTMIRHIDQPFARAAAAALTPTDSTAPFIEPAPQAIASLLATVRQMKRGLAAIDPTVPSAVLDDADETLALALKAAEHAVNDEPLSDAEGAKDLPKLLGRIAALDDGPLVAIVSDDAPSHRLLAAATGRVEPVLMLVREAGKDEPILVAGAHVAHHEIVTDTGEAPTDATWLPKVGTAARPSFTATFRFLPPSAK